MIIPQYRAGCPHVTHPSATKMERNPAEALILTLFVRLACVKHAASVHPEPGSNSHNKCWPSTRNNWLFKPLSFSLLFLVAQSSDCCSWCQDRSRLKLFQNLSRLFHCSVIKVLCCCCFATAMIGYHSFRCLSTTFLFYFFALRLLTATARL